MRVRSLECIGPLRAAIGAIVRHGGGRFDEVVARWRSFGTVSPRQLRALGARVIRRPARSACCKMLTHRRSGAATRRSGRRVPAALRPSPAACRVRRSLRRRCLSAAASMSCHTLLVRQPPTMSRTSSRLDRWPGSTYSTSFASSVSSNPSSGPTRSSISSAADVSSFAPCSFCGSFDEPFYDALLVDHLRSCRDSLPARGTRSPGPTFRSSSRGSCCRANCRARGRAIRWLGVRRSLPSLSRCAVTNLSASSTITSRGPSLKRLAVQSSSLTSRHRAVSPSNVRSEVHRRRAAATFGLRRAPAASSSGSSPKTAQMPRASGCSAASRDNQKRGPCVVSVSRPAHLSAFGLRKRCV